MADIVKSRNIRFIVSYDGTDFVGWQKQPNGNSVQEEIEKVLSQIFNTPIKTIGSGRTDSGVHAFEQNLNFRIPVELNHPDLLYAVNRLLPYSIRVQKAFFAPDEFHSQHSALKKHYRYRLLQTKVFCPLRRNFVWWPGHFFDLEILNQITQILVGKHDFKSFQSTGTPVSSTVRRVLSASWSQVDDEIQLDITGEGFLKQMVRNIVGSVIQFYQKSNSPISAMQELLAAQNRRLAAPPAPAQGLYLMSVSYPEALESACKPLPKKISH